MRIGLIDVDGHNFPNLALMRISAYHKAQGDEVVWWWSDFEYYDIVYKSKIFSDAYSKDVPDPFNCGKVVRGGRDIASRLAKTAKSISIKARTTLSHLRWRVCFQTTASIHSLTLRSPSHRGDVHAAVHSVMSQPKRADAPKRSPTSQTSGIQALAKMKSASLTQTLPLALINAT